MYALGRRDQEGAVVVVLDFLAACSPCFFLCFFFYSGCTYIRLFGGAQVSAFGEGGEGDGGDSWRLECLRRGDESWSRDSSVRLRHVDTKK